MGKTNDYPRGKLNEHDEGGLRIAIGVQDRTIIVDFGTPTAWIGLDKQTALALAASLTEKASQL